MTPAIDRLARAAYSARYPDPDAPDYESWEETGETVRAVYRVMVEAVVVEMDAMNQETT